MANGRIWIGLSGWAYKHWRGDFYPPDLRQADELSYAAARFPTLETTGRSIRWSSHETCVTGMTVFPVTSGSR